METGNFTETKKIIDTTKDYTNLIIISNMDTIKNITALEETANYAYNAGLSFFVRMEYPTQYTNFNYNPFQWEQLAKNRYGFNEEHI